MSTGSERNTSIAWSGVDREQHVRAAFLQQATEEEQAVRLVVDDQHQIWSGRGRVAVKNGVTGPILEEVLIRLDRDEGQGDREGGPGLRRGSSLAARTDPPCSSGGDSPSRWKVPVRDLRDVAWSKSLPV